MFPPDNRILAALIRHEDGVIRWEALAEGATILFSSLHIIAISAFPRQVTKVSVGWEPARDRSALRSLNVNVRCDGVRCRIRNQRYASR
jgi:hypothetical protein